MLILGFFFFLGGVGGGVGGIVHHIMGNFGVFVSKWPITKKRIVVEKYE